MRVYYDRDADLKAQIASVVRGAEDGLKTVGQSLAEKTSYKRGATEFSSQMQKLVAANVDLIVLGTVVRETIGGIVAARQLGFAGDFIGCEAAYQIHHNMHEGKLGVLCLAPEEGLGIDDPEFREQVGEDRITVARRYS